MGRVKTVFYSITWLFVLILFAWWVGLAAGILHCIVSPCGACCKCCKTLMDRLAKGIQLPYLVSTFVMEGMSFKSAIVACHYKCYQDLLSSEENYQQC